MSTESTEHAHPDQAGGASPMAPGREPAALRRSGLWRAIAGMAVALAIAASIVAIDMSHELVARITNYRSRIASLNQRVDRLKRQAVTDEKRLAAARAEIKERKLMQSKDRVKAILIAPDRRTFKLASPNSADLASATVSGTLSATLTATLTMSAKMGGAVLSARGLASPPDGQVYDAWWMLKDAPPAKAAEFRSAADGSVSEYLDLPPPGARPPVSFIVTR